MEQSSKRDQINFNDISSDLLKDLVEKKELYLIFTDNHGYVHDTCSSIAEMTGVKKKGFKNKHMSDYFHPDFKTDIEQRFEPIKHQREDQTQPKKAPLLLKNGNILWCKLFSPHSVNKDKNIKLVIHLIENIDDQQELKEALSDTETFTELVLENIPDPIFVKDKEFKIILANEAFLNFYPEEKKSNIIGTTTFEDYKPDEMQAFLKQDKISFKDGFSQIVEKITVPNGDVRVLETRKIRFENTKSEQYILGICKDITENHRLIENLKKSNSDLNEFSYIAAHDLKSPMNAIRKIAGWLHEDCKNKLDDSSLKHLKLLMSRAERMLKLLDDLLEYSTIEKKDYPFNKIDLKQTFAQLIDYHTSQLNYSLASDMNHIFVPNIPFKTIINNLISNAIKHHPNNNPKIIITLKRGAKSDRFIFEDDGYGIAEEFRKEATQVFKTLKPRDQVEGSGVGLSLIKKMVEHYSGTLSLRESDLGGLKVVLEWPINKFFISEGL